MSYVPAPEPTPAKKSTFGAHLDRAFKVYMAQWQDWLAPTAISIAIGILAYMCCILPYFLALGPIAVGMFACALHALRGMKVEAAMLNRGQQLLGKSMLAGLAIFGLQALPMLLLIGLFYAMFFGLIFGTAVVSSQGQGGAEGVAVLGFLTIMLLFGVGMLASVAWSLWIGTRTMFVLPLIADLGIDVRDAWSQSWAATRQGFWELLLLHFLAGLIGMIGMYAFYIGLLFTIPLYFLIIGAAYEERFGRSLTAPATPLVPPG